MIEIDVQLTRDGELLLVHDWEVGGQGARWTVEESNGDTLRSSSSQDDNLPTAPMPTLEEVLALVPDQVPLNIEIKHRRAGRERLRDRLLEAIEERPRVLLSSFDWDLLSVIRRVRPEALLAPIGDRRPHDLLRAAESLRAATIHCHRRLAFGDFIAAARAGGWPVLVYTIDDPAFAAKLFERGVAGVFSDRPGQMIAALEI